METSPREVARAMPGWLRGPAVTAVDHIQHGTFQRSMSLLVAGTSVVSGLEVAYEHYKGSYSNPVMYTPVVLSGVVAAAGVAAFFSGRMARTFLRWASYTTLVDGVVGFGFHVRGIARKPGGWRLPVTNIVMGPPIFAPLLFGTSAYLGVIASYLQREEEHGAAAKAGQLVSDVRRLISHPSPWAKDGAPGPGWREEIRHGRFQRHLCMVAAVGTVASGAEAWYSHYKDNFKFRVQWSPIVLTPLMVAATLGARMSRSVANTLLPVASGLLMLNGAIGTGYHVRGILQRPGGKRKPIYNVLYGPPIFAPMLFAACGLLGALAYLMRREPRS